MNTPASATVKSTCIPTIYLVGLAIPILLVILFYFGKPSFVMTRREGSNDMHLGWTQIGKWTAIISLVAWIGLYLYQNYAGGDKSAVCLSYSKESAVAPAVVSEEAIA